MEPQSTTPTTTQSFNFIDHVIGTEPGYGLIGDNQHEGFGFNSGLTFSKIDRSVFNAARIGNILSDNFLTNAAGKVFQKASDVTDRLLHILREEYRFQACLDAGYGRAECR